LLRASHNELVLADMTQPESAAVHVAALLDDGVRLLEVARKAATRARQW